LTREKQAHDWRSHERDQNGDTAAISLFKHIAIFMIKCRVCESNVEPSNCIVISAIKVGAVWSLNLASNKKIPSVFLKVNDGEKGGVNQTISGRNRERFGHTTFQRTSSDDSHPHCGQRSAR
jgi:hypothetical protein